VARKHPRRKKLSLNTRMEKRRLTASAAFRSEGVLTN